MKKYDSKDVRTLAFVGHGKCGKTSLAEAFLFDTKATTRLGKVDDESSNLDTEPEELKRKSSLQCAVGSCEWKKVKINFIDTPGDGNFVADAELGTSAVDAAIVVVSAPDGVQVGTERAWEIVNRLGLPRVVFLNKVDRERANFETALKDVREVLSDKAVALQIPIGQEGAFAGVVDLLSLKAYTFTDEGRQMTVGDVPANLTAAASAAREQLIEGIASSDDKLIEKYLETGELSEEEITKGLSGAILAGTIVPVLCGSATRNLGVQPLMDVIANTFPSPLDRPPTVGVDAAGAEVARKGDQNEPFSARVFKVISADIGKIALCRVISGTLHSDATVLNPRKGSKERVGTLYTLIGRKRENLTEAVAGDVIGLAKLKDTKTGDTLCDEKSVITYPMVKLPEPVISFSIRPKSKGDEEKVASRLADLMEEDPSLKLDRDQVSKEILLRGLGQIHIEMAVEKLRRHGVDVELAAPKIPYRETIRGKAVDVEGKHKKQSGGRGQFGVVYIDMEPKPKDSEVKDDPLEFVDAIFGGSVPRQFIPAVEKGIRDRMARGVIAGYPVVDIRVTLKDGKYHDVDSDGRSFERAGSKGFQEAFRQSTPALLEPIMNLEVTCPDEYMGDIIGDVSSRRGKVLGTDTKGRSLVIKAMVPLAELLKYAIDLESITAGRGAFTMSFAHYDEVPGNLAEKIIANAKMAAEEDD
ncbi:MAG: elongation factor G [Deltaproteobacteria bacterium]|nr:elongation factor G [Deltaproteobacteria bacterium]